jgi:hypothetical protein
MVGNGIGMKEAKDMTSFTAVNDSMDQGRLGRDKVRKSKCKIAFHNSKEFSEIDNFEAVFSE